MTKDEDINGGELLSNPFCGLFLTPSIHGELQFQSAESSAS